MAPRIANDSFPDEFLTVDYESLGPGPIGGGGGGLGGTGGGGGGGGGTTTHAANELNLDAGDAAAAAAAADAEFVAAVPPPTAGAGGDGAAAAQAASIENDPLSVGQPGIGTSRSASTSDWTGGSDAVPEVATTSTMGTTVTATMAMGTTVTATMAAAAQRAWDQFVAGQEAEGQQQQQQHQVFAQQQMQHTAMEGITVGGGGTSGGGGYSPSSMPQATSPSAAFGHHAMNDATPSTYQQMLQFHQQNRQDIAAASSASSGDPLSVHSAPPLGIVGNSSDGSSEPMHQHPGLLRRVSGRGSAVPRALSFGGFSEGATPAPSTPAAVAVSRSGSAASSLTGTVPGSAHSSINASSYQRFLSGLQHPPLETIASPDGTLEESPGTYGSIHSAEGFSTSMGGASSPDEMTPGSDAPDGEGEAKSPDGLSRSQRGAEGSSPKLPYSPSLLDQTSFPEDDLSAAEPDGDDDEDSGDKYSPISKLDWGDLDGDGEGDVKMDTTADTADTTVSGSGGPVSLNPQGLSSSGRGLATHVIHEDSAAPPSVPAPQDSHPLPPASTGLRPRPFPFSQANGGGARNLVLGEAFADPTAAPASATATIQVPSPVQIQRPTYSHQVSDVSVASGDGSVQLHVTPPPLSFGPETTISDLTYYAEKGCVVDVLAALTNPHLKTLGARMLADYAKMPHRRVAVASNARILEFVQQSALEVGPEHVAKYISQSWLGREYAVETVRSLTAAEENDRYLMSAPGLLQTLALVARGGPFVRHNGTRFLSASEAVVVTPPSFDGEGPGPGAPPPGVKGVSSDKTRLHACIAVMNLSCGKSNKVDITNVPEVLEAMRDVMLGRHFSASPRTSSSSSRAGSNVADEARLKATTCIKNLSNADANDAALLATPGLVETLGHVAEATCHPKTGATTCTTHACLALMNLSISKANKNRVFRTPGVMDALMAVITRTAPRGGSGDGEAPNPKDPNFEARIKACSALSNLAIGYDNKIPMFHYPGFVESILTVIRTDTAEARTKACSILWSFAAEMKNQVPVVRRGDILPALVSVAKEDTKTEARFKCVAALTLLAESPENAVPLLWAGSLEPLMNVLQEAGPDPTQWRGQTASWCVGFLMNMAQCDDVVPALLQEGIVDLLAPLLSLDHYQSLKAAMAVTFVCQYDTGDKTYNLLRQTENVIPKIVGLLHNTLSGRGGSGYKYGVFTLRSSVGCIASLAAGPDFMKERIATNPVFESLLKVVEDFCVDGGTPGAIVGGGKDDARSVTLAVRALGSLIGHLIPEPGCAAMPFGPAMDDQLVVALRSFEESTHPEINDATRQLAHAARIRVEGGKGLHGRRKSGSVSSDSSPDDLSDDGGGIALGIARKFFPFPCGMNLHVPSNEAPQALSPLPPTRKGDTAMDISDEDCASATAASVQSTASSGSSPGAVRTFLLTDSATGRRYAVPCDPTGGRQFNDNRVWCFRRGRYCAEGEMPDPNFRWSEELQAAYGAALRGDSGIVEES
ncbi:hypothetical protein ACHAWF_014574 [Thalassiosira exigua]